MRRKGKWKTIGRCRTAGGKASDLVMRYDGTDLFIFLNGKPIAKRGHPGTRFARTWISLEPGLAVHDDESGRAIVVEFTASRAH